MPALIDIQNVTKTYQMGDTVVHALNNVTLQIERGEYVAIMGHSGSGKSTMLNILGCLDTPSSGTYRLDGRLVNDMTRNELALFRNRTIGFVFQNFNLLTRTSARENVELPSFYSSTRMTGAERRRKAIDLLTKVGLGDRLDHSPAQLSGGQQQRVAIARALMNDPSVIFADEPTGNLDTKSSLDIIHFLSSLNAEGITIVMVTHEEDIAAYARRKIVFQDGKVIA